MAKSWRPPANPVPFKLHASTHSLLIPFYCQIRPHSVPCVARHYTVITGSPLYCTPTSNPHVECVARVISDDHSAARPPRTRRTPLNTPWSSEIPARLSG